MPHHRHLCERMRVQTKNDARMSRQLKGPAHRLMSVYVFRIDDAMEFRSYHDRNS